MSTRKRLIDDSVEPRKRLKVTTEDGTDVAVESVPKQAPAQKPRKNRRKLTAPRPFPTVPTSVSASGPRSAHTEGKNLICITRKTSLGNYLRRCKDVIIKDGYKTLHLSAMGAAIPLLLQLSVALPPILPFSSDEIRTEVTTGTVEVTDEILPEDDEHDITQETRGKSTLQIVITIGDGEPPSRNAKKRRHAKPPTTAPTSEVVIPEPEQVEMEMV
ncbi:hypothetical protein D9758_001512 [Tetrapyrgos nigripes]|uniref:Uncharacterized protein n=1 Tax=Tetrapyrgos nigripes TaxID=182062 RepID=A0A8H5GXP0_9AGAR|nr:hypothetical protein D9758_001512 [Tetrapyrgos nigripes]